MTNRVRRQVEWMVGELLREASEGTVISVMCRRNTVRVFLNSEEIASLSEDTACFGSAMSREQVERLYDIHRCCPKVRSRRARDEERW